MSRTHTSDDVDPADIRDAKTYLRLRTIPKLSGARANFPYFPLAEVRADLEGQQKGVEPESINQYLYELTKQGVVFDAGRGWYSTLNAPFVLDREPVRELVEWLEKRFPLLDFSCWSTRQVAGYGHHLLARFCSFVYTERDAMESVADALRDGGKAVYVDAAKREVGSHVRLTDGVVIVRPLVTRAPVDGHYAFIEKILVDLLKEADDLNLMDRAEYVEIEKKVVSAARIAVSTMLGYAERRNAAGDMLTWAIGKYIKTKFRRFLALIYRTGNAAR